MKHLNCEETKRQVHEFLSQELTEDDLENITAHLANCDSCEEHYDFELAFSKVIKDSCDEAPPQELADRILARVRALANEDETVVHETLQSLTDEEEESN